MTPAAFVAKLRACGGQIALNDAGNCLEVDVPRRVVPADAGRFEAFLKSHKPALIALLDQEARPPAADACNFATADNAPAGDEPDELLREAYLIASACMGGLPVCLTLLLLLPSGRAASNVNAFVRGSVARWRHAQAKDDPDALAFAGTTWRDVAEQEAADLDACAARFAADPRDFDTDVLANAHEWFEANAQKEQNDER